MKALLNTESDIKKFIKPLDLTYKIMGDVNFNLHIVPEKKMLYANVMKSDKTAIMMLKFNADDIFTNIIWPEGEMIIGIRDLPSFIRRFTISKSNLEVEFVVSKSEGDIIYIRKHDTADKFESCFYAADSRIIKEGPKELSDKFKEWHIELELDNDMISRIKRGLSVCNEEKVLFKGTKDGTVYFLITEDSRGANSFKIDLGVDSKSDFSVWMEKGQFQSLLSYLDSSRICVGDRVCEFTSSKDGMDLMMYLATFTSS